jgi:RHS repeat-associated protein
VDALVAHIDPAVGGMAGLIASTYLGGSGEDVGADIAVDASGNAYISGILGSSVVTKLNPSGSAVLYSTIIAGASGPGLRIAVDSAQQAYLVGTTLSPSFPATANAYQSTCNPGDTANCSPEGDAFVTKLNASGVPIYSSYLGGSDGDQGMAVVADNTGKVYVTGITTSASFPTKTPYQSCVAGGHIFVTKIDTTLSGAASLIYSTCLRGNGTDWGNDIAIDASGAAYIAGWSTSTDFPTTSGVIRPTHTTSEGEGVVIKLNAAGTDRSYATYLGGNGYDSAAAIAVDSSGNAYVTGTTGSTDIPHPNGYQIACGDSGCSLGDTFVVKLNATATNVLYGTYLGGTGSDEAMGIALDSQQMVYVTGFAGANFPTTPDRLRASGDSYLAKLNPAVVGADSMVYSTYLGGNDWVDARAVAVDAGGNAFVTGDTLATDLGTAGAAQFSFSGGEDPPTDAFVLKVSAAQRLTQYTYDGLQRLIGANVRPGSVYTYTYDLAGNRTAVQLNSGTPTVTSYNAANQITNAGFTYDAAGNLLNDGTAASTYDALSRTTARGTMTYAYNGDGTLVSQATGGVTTRYTQDLAAPLSQVLQTKVGTAAITDYLYGLSRLASLNSGVKTWYAADALGSVRRTVTDAGVPLGIVNYDPWGTPETGTVPTFGFAGELQDVGAGLVNLRARWYSTGRGRFTSVDPFAGMAETPYSLHQYQYGYADPVGKTDPTGKYIWQDDTDDVDARDLTSWLYREMMHNIDDPRLQFVKTSNQYGDYLLHMPCTELLSTTPYFAAAATFYYLVRDHGPWDFKHKIKDFLGEGITICSSGGCRKDTEYSVTGNIHFGFVAAAARFLATEIQAGAGIAEATDPAHDPQKAVKAGVTYTGPYDPHGKFGPISVDSEGNWYLNLGDDPQDALASAFGISLYRKYGRTLTLDTFRNELQQVLPYLAAHEPRRGPVRSDIAKLWPYQVGYFNP